MQRGGVSIAIPLGSSMGARGLYLFRGVCVRVLHEGPYRSEEYVTVCAATVVQERVAELSETRGVGMK